MNKILNRSKCLINEDKNMETLHVFEKAPVFMGCVDSNIEADIFNTMTWQINKETGFIQLKELIPLSILYPCAHNAGLIGKTWMEHHEAFAFFIKKFNPSNVFEIGGSHGILYRNYRAIQNIKWSILDLNPIPIEDLGIKFITGCFDENSTVNEDFDTLVHSHFLEHVYDPGAIIRKMADLIKYRKKMIFSIPNMEAMLNKKYSNCLNFEHTFFLSEPYLEFFLSQSNLKIVEKQYFLSDHSIFYCVEYDTNVEKKILNKDLYQVNKKAFKDYVNYYDILIHNLNKQINTNVFLFGAHIFSQNLLTFGLDHTKINCIIDNDQQKQNKRLYGTSLFVKSPNVLMGLLNPEIIISAGVYNKEIKEQIFKINPSAVIHE